MPVVLKNKQIELHIDLPNEIYTASRFDYTGKIVKLKYQDLSLTGSESLDKTKDTTLGKGFYNEFGIDKPFNFSETAKGDWFHKIGVGLLHKDEDAYLFHKTYSKKALKFKVDFTETQISIACTSPLINGYAYKLIKKIEIFDDGFIINYYLENIGDKDIVSNEYVHNFLAINNDAIGTNYILKFPFKLKPKLFDESLNSENKVLLKDQEVGFIATPKKDYFFSNLSGNEWVKAEWELINTKHNIRLYIESK